ncbi:hypothetical protein DOTSEDRAFT_88360 [Dothistroma septosporum NZE10]|uniref:Zn(2)-C6 fungal-type domain-containing protein n=1 Tax=Dothistroma septosporum (strain NZE10 / CBS 128990) TaxID=675120 RepID=N1PKV7_DOTSN|nr:hypothetical protein DOTSEDRAFT_88360 [Dothistroma septosporum NZE10]
MAPDIKSEDLAYDNARPLTADTSAAEAALKAKLSRKRTKTGCLTCRKRRIKCGEERPVCKNCIKSKRHCDGYNQRVIFKQPTFDYQPAPHGGAHITFQAGFLAGPSSTHPDIHAAAYNPDGFAHAQQQHHGRQYIQVFDTQLQQYVPVEQPPRQLVPQIQHPLQHGHDQLVPHFEHAAALSFNQAQQPSFRAQYLEVIHDGAQDTPYLAGAAEITNAHATTNFQPMAAAAVHFNSQQDASQTGQVVPVVTMPTEHIPDAYRPAHGSAGAHTNLDLEYAHTQAWLDAKPVATEHDIVVPTPVSATSVRTMSFSQTPAVVARQSWEQNNYAPRPETGHPNDYNHHVVQNHQPQPSPALSGPQRSLNGDDSTPEYYEHEVHAAPYATPTYMLNTAAVETQDDDYYDVEQDDEMDIDTNASAEHGFEWQRKLSRILALNQISICDVQTRRYDTFIYAGILDKYRVEEKASPLKNPATARVFAHFISATGPSLSIFERHPRNTSMMFNESSIPVSQRGLWTYTLPVAALRNQGLLHAMLALASLHIARLQNASVTPSMQHYAWALKRIHNSVATPRGRLKVTTIAATMLLGFYEVMTADHMKWNAHLAGSKQLFVDTDFVSMTKEFRRLKREKATRQQFGRNRRRSSEEPWMQDDLLDQIMDVDERVVSHMVGKEVRYEDHGGIETPHVSIPPGLDVSKFEILKDLYWWYCKQDVIQSIVSGNHLLMDFSRWANCSPRAPLGRGDAVHGTFDHLVLLLGRIADFSSRDRQRKLKQMDANGGNWRPTPGMNIPRPPKQPPPPVTPVPAKKSFPMPGTTIPPQGPRGGPAMPQFFGMAPAPRVNVQMPSVYRPNQPMSSPEDARPYDPSEGDLQAQTAAALEEYGRIRAALHTFQTSLGKDFEPLGPDYYVPEMTAFGPALVYRSYDIGCMWALYNMAVIIAIRAHPHMPPAAHVAAAIAAQDTAFFANEVGRIAAGIVPGAPEQPLNPSLGAALCESCMPSFFAAVQYQDPLQRRETVTRIWSIAKRTGWGSAELIANGCETAWVKAAAAGRGPPYERIARPQEYTHDPRLNGSWERLDPTAQPNEMDDTDRRLVKQKAQARLNWAIGVMGVEDDVHKIHLSD